MRGYLIDVIEGKTHSVDVFDLEDYQKFIHCQTIDIVSRTIGDREYEIICDDEGLSKRPALVSAVNNDGQPMLVEISLSWEIQAEMKICMKSHLMKFSI